MGQTGRAERSSPEDDRCSAPSRTRHRRTVLATEELVGPIGLHNYDNRDHSWTALALALAPAPASAAA
jgi:hypothetical protein